MANTQQFVSMQILCCGYVFSTISLTEEIAGYIFAFYIFLNDQYVTSPNACPDKHVITLMPPNIVMFNSFRTLTA